MKPVRLVAMNEWQIMRRSRVAQLCLLIILALSVVAAWTSQAHRDSSQALRERFQAQADQEFDNQPARHPHRMVHYGHFVFRPLPVLAAFDPGVDAFTGNTIFLEGHRQNSANFGDVRQSSLLARFGQLTPAFVLQVLAPLVLIFVGFGAIARERDSGTLRQLRACGVTTWALIGGKFLALARLVAVMLTPAIVLLGWLVAKNDSTAFAAMMLITAYGLYLLLWAIMIVTISALVKDARGALLALLGLWLFTSILVPRVAPDFALAAHPLPTRLETDIAIQRDLRQIGDSHNADDPYFAAFKARLLTQHGVRRVEDLPLNYRGLLAMEGERLTTGLFEKYSQTQFAQQSGQSALVTGFGLLSPAIAMRQVSMALSGTDLEEHRRFLRQAEAYRFNIVQQLNRYQAEAVTYADDSHRNQDPEAARRVRIDPRNWQDVPQFSYRAATAHEKIRAAVPGAIILLLWLCLVLVCLHTVSRRMKDAL